MLDLADQEIDELAMLGDPEADALMQMLVDHPLYTFEPRPDCPEEFDEQSAFVNSDAKFAICLGGTGSGKTEAAAFKTARYVLGNAPPRHLCPFWIIGETYDLACGVCWAEKLSRYIPKSEILDYNWFKPALNWPFAVILRHPVHRSKPGWVLEFKSYGQGRDRFQSASIGGYWFNEAVDGEIVIETQGRCRDYGSPGWADFTPIDLKTTFWIEKSKKPPKGWRFYRLNMEKNHYTDDEWRENYLSTVPEDERETRRIGAFSQLEGLVYKEFQHDIHVVEPFEIPASWHKVRTIDFGFSNPFVCLWLARDGDGRWYVYDEHYRTQTHLEDHAAAIKRRPWRRGTDGYGNTYSDHAAQERAELQRLGVVTLPANKEVMRGIRCVKSLLTRDKSGRPRLYFFSTAKHTIDEIGSYWWPEGTDTRNPTEAPIAVDDHCMDALRYGLYSELKRTGAAPAAIKAPWRSRADMQFRR